jgi:murein DD-endopeptidase MepM/ murein hydrolase activator NlpD
MGCILAAGDHADHCIPVTIIPAMSPRAMSGPSSSLRRAPRRKLAGVLALAVLMAPLTVDLAGAQDTGDVEDLRQEREDKRREAADVAAELDALQAEDDELTAAIAALEAHIALQETRVAAAEEAIADAEARAVMARSQAEALDAEMVVIRERLERAAIDAFVAPRPDALAQLDDENLLDVELRQSYVEEVVGDEYELIDELRVAQAAQADAIRRADDATRDAEDERAALAERLVELDESRREVEALKAQVEVRIDEWETVSREIEEADALIAQQIRELEAELARQAAAEAQRLAEEEAARQAAEEAAAEEAAAEDPDVEVDEETEGQPGDDSAPSEIAEPQVDGAFTITHRPVPGAVTSRFGPRVHPIFGTTRNHYGLDFNGSTGDSISAAADGTVITAGWMNGFGNVVIISHGNGYSSLYAHQSEVLVSLGDTVAGGERIGRVGSTGWSTGPHLHFEIRVDGTAVDPLPYL